VKLPVRPPAAALTSRAIWKDNMNSMGRSFNGRQTARTAAGCRFQVLAAPGGVNLGSSRRRLAAVALRSGPIGTENGLSNFRAQGAEGHPVAVMLLIPAQRVGGSLQQLAATQVVGSGLPMRPREFPQQYRAPVIGTAMWPESNRAPSAGWTTP